MNPLRVEHQPKEPHARLFDVTFVQVEHQPVFARRSHQSTQVPVVFRLCLLKDTDVVRDPDLSRALLKDIIHAFLKDILSQAKAKWQPAEAVSTAGAVESRE